MPRATAAVSAIVLNVEPGWRRALVDEVELVALVARRHAPPSP